MFSFEYGFRCARCHRIFQKEFLLEFVSQGPPPKDGWQDRLCWEWQRDRGPVFGQRQTGCTGNVRWNWNPPVQHQYAEVLTEAQQLCALYRNHKWGIQRFSMIPMARQADVRSIIGVANGPAYAGALDRGGHNSDPRGHHPGKDQSPPASRREYHLGADQEGRMTRAAYGGVMAFYYSKGHAAMTYTYWLIVNDNDVPYLRGGVANQLQQP